MKTKTHTPFKALFILIFFFFLGLQPNVLYAQFTDIPDANFEGALIDLGIDSDGIINGQVLTSDIDIVITLDLFLRGIGDLTGIEDFAALESLDVTSNDLISLDVSDNIQLKELYASNTGTANLMISSLDLSNNINLELLSCGNLFSLESLNLKNGNNSILTAILQCKYEGEPCVLELLNCITVDDEEAATNDEFPYSDWFIEADFFYSEDCSLGIEDNLQSQVVISPNPANDLIHIETDYFINSIRVFNTLGRLVIEQNNPSNLLDVSSLSTGLLFVQIETDEGSITKKIIKE